MTVAERKNQFVNYLLQKFSERRTDDIISALEQVEATMIKKQYIPCKLYEIEQPDKIADAMLAVSKNKFFRFYNRKIYPQIEMGIENYREFLETIIEKRRAEEARIAEEKRRAEEARIAEEKRRAEEARLAEEKRRAAEKEEQYRLATERARREILEKEKPIRSIVWHEDEVELLIDTFYDIQAGKIKRFDAVKMLSKELRRRAEKDYKVPEDFRNIKSVTTFLASVEYYCTNGQSGLQTTSSLIERVLKRKQHDAKLSAPVSYMPRREETVRQQEKTEVSTTKEPSKSLNNTGQSQASQYERFTLEEAESMTFDLHARPISVNLFGVEYPCNDWADLYRQFNIAVFKKYSTTFSVNDIQDKKYASGCLRYMKKVAQIYAFDLSKIQIQIDQGHGTTYLGKKQAGNSRSSTIVKNDKDLPNRKKFYEWLLSQGYAENSARGYISALNSFDGILNREGIIDKSIFEIPTENELLKLEDAMNTTCDRHQKCRFRTPFRKYCYYCKIHIAGETIQSEEKSEAQEKTTSAKKARQPLWDKYEAVILLDALLAVRDGAMNHKEAIKYVSQTLRRRAVLKGMDIDERFRNEAGIEMQMARMEYALTDGKIGLSSQSTLFNNTVRLYKTAWVSYRKLLREAKNELHELEQQAAMTSQTAMEQKPVAEQTVRQHTVSLESNQYRSNSQLSGEIIDAAKQISQNSDVPQKAETPADTLPTSVEEAYDEVKQRRVAYLEWLRRNGVNQGFAFMSLQVLKQCGKYAQSLKILDQDIFALKTRKEIEELINELQKNADFLRKNRQQKNRLVDELTKYKNFMGEYQNNSPVTSEPQNDIIKRDAIVSEPEQMELPLQSQPKVQDKSPDLSNNVYYSLLKQKFSKGFRANSRIAFKQFRTQYANVYGKTLECSDEVILEEIKKVTIQHGDRMYLPDMMLGEDKKQMLMQYIETTFAKGKNAIYYTALFEQFSDDFLEEKIYTPDMLKTYLKYINDGSYVINRLYLAKDENVCVAPLDEIIELLCQKKDAPVMIEQICQELPHLPKDLIENNVKSSAEIICNKRGESYFHVSAIDLNDTELENIARIIQHAIDTQQFETSGGMYAEVRAQYPDIIERYEKFSQNGFRDAMAYYFRDRFTFSKNIICAHGMTLKTSDIYANFAKTRDHFTIGELNLLKSELDTVINFDKVYENSLRISQNDFVSLHTMSFDVAKTDEAIGQYCTGEYIPLKDVDDFSSFPYVGVAWNIYLLEQFVFMFSEKYKLIHTGFTAGSSSGAIVRKESKIDTLDKLLTAELAESGHTSSVNDAFNYLIEKGYLVGRGIQRMDKIVIDAKVQRSKRG